jgi:hypothetical protein
MTAQRQTEVAEFIVAMAREFPAARAEQLVELMRLAKRHDALAVRECNVGDVTDTAWERIQAKIGELCKEIGCKVKCGGDPRGYTVKVFLPSGRYNTWGGAEEGWGVPS